MLKTRLLTAVMLIPFVVLAMLLLPTTVFTFLLAVVVLLAAWEWLHFIGISTNIGKALTAGFITLSSVLTFQFLPVNLLLVTAMVVWCFALIVVSVFGSRPMPHRLAKLLHLRAVNIAIALVVFCVFLSTSVLVHQSSTSGPSLLLFVVVTVWLADTGGFFAGKRFGKYKLAVEISPNKTWEGVAGALVLSSIWATTFYYLSNAIQLPICVWLAINVLTVLFSIVGDLFESVFKRSFQVKDSGNLLPGHGGVLDRIDSQLAAVPVFAVTMMILGAM